MCTLLNNGALAHNDDFVSVSDSGKSMSDDDACLCSGCQEIVESYLDDFFTLSVQSACSFVQKNNLRLANQCPSDCYTLLLAS